MASTASWLAGLLLLVLHSSSSAHEHAAEHDGAAAHSHQITAQHIIRLAGLIKASTQQHQHSGHHHSHGHTHTGHPHLDLTQVLGNNGDVIPPDKLSAAVLSLLECAEQPDSCIIHGAEEEDSGIADSGSKGLLATLFWWLKPAEDGHVKPSTKVAAALLLFVETVIGLLVPPLISQVDGHSWWLSLLNSFAGGIFLTAGLMHLVPHCAEAQESVNLASWHLPSHYPLYLLLICLGYLLVFCVERVVFEGHEHSHVHGCADGHHHHTDDDHAHDQLLEGLLPTNHVGSRGGYVRKRRKSGAGSEQEEVLAAGMKDGTGSAGALATGMPAQHETVTIGWGAALRNRQPGSTHQRHSHFNVIKGLPLLVGMSVHTSLECIALGLMTRHTSFLVLLCAIAAHKGVSALALSAKFTKEGADLRQVALLVGPFCLVAPTSILAGHVAGAFLSPSIQLLLNCLAAGTFLYVGASEILAEEFEGDVRAGRRDMSPTQARVIKFCMVMVAVVCIAALGLMPHEH